MAMGICLVNLVHSRSEAGDFMPPDCRIYAPEQDTKTKNDHFLDMFQQAVKEDKVRECTISFDFWYVGIANLKEIHRAGWTFFTTFQRNRLMSLSIETSYQKPDSLDPPA